MNKEQIIQAFKCCVLKNRNCLECPYDKLGGCQCIDRVKLDALELIMAQDQKIFELENRLKENENGYAQTLYMEKCKNAELTKENESLAKSVNEASELIRKKNAEIERMKGCLTLTVKLDDKQIEKLKADCVLSVETDIKNIKVETIKRMVDGLNTRIAKKLAYHGWYLRETIIPLVAKQVLEDEAN